MSATEAKNLSPFYLACRNDDLNKVKELITSMTLDEINKVESNGSTALHACSYYGHKEIVKCLLDHGCSRQQLNKYKLTPEQEAKTDDIKKLFGRSSSGCQQRFTSSNQVEFDWTFNDPLTAINNRLFHFDHGITTVTNKITYTEVLAHDTEGMKQVLYYLDNARKTNDLSFVLRAYTAETDFYKKLNLTLAMDDCSLSKASEGQAKIKWAEWYTGLIANNSQFKKYEFKHGQTYRGIKCTQEDLKRYVVGQVVCNKSFLSTTKDRHIAQGFAGTTDHSDKNISVMFTYIIKSGKNVTAFYLEEVSEYPSEKEVLILPQAIFIVKNILKQQENGKDKYQVELEEDEKEYKM
ncbi:unnamed protein product [Rotaria sp. Silwood2]|nr:unnamed protein product [Rotaria sp. Silwood2]CAF4460551.1 unnamed protein product [Rotaria sp. Silwood2]CAF4759071.1 unnamed protein product [Rotaria sp. Silwood2]